MKEIFWGDYAIGKDEMKEMIQNGSDYDKKVLFQKIISNSSDMIKDLSYFDKDDLKALLYEYKIPNFNKDYIEKRVKIAKRIFFQESCFIRELEWIE